MRRRYVHSGQSRRGRRPEKGGRDADEPTDHALGRSRGGFGTKLHLLTDGQGLPLTALVTPGQAHKSTPFAELLGSMHIPQQRGRPRQRPHRVLGDRAYHAQRIRHWLRRRGIQAVIPPRRSRGQRRRGRPVTYDAQRYRQRNVIERCVGWLKECRSVATRYEKLALNYLGLVKLAMIERYLRLL